MSELVRRFYEIFKEYYEKYQEFVVKSDADNRTKISIATRLAKSFYSQVKPMFMDDVHFEVFKFNRPLRTVHDYELVNGNYLLLKGSVRKYYSRNPCYVKYYLLIGEDFDSGKLFCNLLPRNFNFRQFYSLETQYEREIYLRNVLGFDYHLEELLNRKISEFEGKTIRIQGDVTMRIVKVFDSIEDLIKYEYEKFINYLIDRLVNRIIYLIFVRTTLDYGRDYDSLITINLIDGNTAKILVKYDSFNKRKDDIYISSYIHSIQIVDGSGNVVSEIDVVNYDREIRWIMSSFYTNDDIERMFGSYRASAVNLYIQLLKKKITNKYVLKSLRVIYGNDLDKILRLARKVIVKRLRNSVTEYYIVFKDIIKNVREKVTKCINYNNIYSSIANAIKSMNYIRYIIRIGDHTIYVIVLNNLITNINDILIVDLFRAEFSNYLPDDVIAKVISDCNYVYEFRGLDRGRTITAYLIPNQIITIQHPQHGEKDIFIDKWCLVEFNTLNRHWFELQLRERFQRHQARNN